MRKTDAARFLDEEAKPVARKRLERSLILDEVSRQEKIGVDNESLDQEFNSTLVDLQAQGLNLNGIRGGKQGQQRVAEAVAMESASRLLTRRTLERLKAIAIGEYKPEEEKAADEPNADVAPVDASSPVPEALDVPAAASDLPAVVGSKTARSKASKKTNTSGKTKPKSK